MLMVDLFFALSHVGLPQNFVSKPFQNDRLGTNDIAVSKCQIFPKYFLKHRRSPLLRAEFEHDLPMQLMPCQAFARMEWGIKSHLNCT